MNDTSNPNNSYVDTYSPPQVSGAQNSSATQANSVPMDQDPVDTTTDPQSKATSPSQSLEDQNIFHLLGVQNVEDAEKESFLDELQQVIWEDFLANDVELLVTENERTELNQIMAKSYESDLDKQEAIVVYLEKLIPDLEEIMLEKALELKQDMVDERIASMRELFAGQTDKIQALDQVLNQTQQDKWYDAAEALNEMQ